MELEEIIQRSKARPEIYAPALAMEALRLRAERDQLRDVLWRGGFVMCDIPACNCGSWHHKYGLPERFREIADVLAEAGHELCNENGNLPIRAIKSLAAERDQLRAELQNSQNRLKASGRAKLREEVSQLRAELAECRSKPQDLHLHANGGSIDCRTCAHYLPPLSFAGDPACELVSSVIVCINGDAYVPADPVRLYETGEA